MTHIDDDKLQELITQGAEVNEEDNRDLKIYKSLFDTLEIAPQAKLKAGFSDRVIRNVVKEQTSQKTPFQLALLGSVSLGFLLLSLITLTIFGADFKFLAPVIEYRWFLFTAAILILFIQLVDKKFVHTDI